ncbi:hypothetical protein D9M72_532690 [compost metagenome]
MLVEEGGDIGVRRLHRRLAASHRGQAHGSAAVVFRVERQHFGIGIGGGIELAGFFQGEGAVIGFRQRFLVDFRALLGHGRFLRPQRRFGNRRRRSFTGAD